ncbi:hypothetical protein BH10BAC1_BH10BAC1_21310 [soil metagenome]
MASAFIDDLLKNLSDSEKKSIDYHFSLKEMSEDLLIKKFIYSAANPPNDKTSLSPNRMLKSRALDQITDILTSDYHLHSKGNFVGHDQILLRLKKKILLARIISKGLTQNKIGPFKAI